MVEIPEWAVRQAFRQLLRRAYWPRRGYDRRLNVLRKAAIATRNWRRLRALPGSLR